MSRAILRLGLPLLPLLVLLSAFDAGAKKPKDKPLKSNAGGAGRAWACKKLADSACDLARRCEPDRSNRYCRKVRERCDAIKDGNAAHATDDDVGTCNDSLADLSCHQVTFENVNGVIIDFKHLDLCSSVYQDNLLPLAKDDSGGDDKAGGDKGSADKAKPDDKASDDDAPKKKHGGDDDAPAKKSDSDD